MMRSKSPDGLVHFVFTSRGICGAEIAQPDLMGTTTVYPSHDPVTCRACAHVYCAIKNAPWHVVDGDVLMQATFDAVHHEQEESHEETV